ncbi:hypothetical protein VKT23_018766 [Stygiomarasmius scandens]|uniref:Uncharacterized protein n=1 Tax=Marasmiellus scandens TaxID=2682957 RepID=A0ABR1IR99_9AGAR
MSIQISPSPIVLSSLDINAPSRPRASSMAPYSFPSQPRSQKSWQSAPRRDRRNTQSHAQSMRLPRHHQQQQQPPRPASSLGFSAQTGIDLLGMGGPVYQRTSRFDPFEDTSDMSISTPSSSSSYTHYYYYDHTTNKPTLAFADPPRHASHARPSHHASHALDTSLSVSSFPAPGLAQGLGLGLAQHYHTNAQSQSQSCNTTTFANSNFNVNTTTPNNLINRNFIPPQSRSLSRSPSPPSPSAPSFYPTSPPGVSRNRSPSPPNHIQNQNPGPRHRSPSPPSPTGSRPGHVRRRSGAMSMGAAGDVTVPVTPTIQAPAPKPKAAALVSQGPVNPPLERPQSAPPVPAPVSKPTTPQRSIHSILSRPLPASSRDTIAGIVASMLLSRADTPSVRSRGKCGAGAGYVKSGLSRVVFVE